jgi:GNAT superfamily N-acetyltransferase
MRYLVAKTQHTKIRTATQDDIFDILVLAKNFSKEAPTTHKWDKEKTAQFLVSALENPIMEIFVADTGEEIVGALVCMKSELYMSRTTVCTELAWFVDKQYRGSPSALRLLKTFEKWAKEQKADYTIMGDIAGITDLGSLYTKLGYTKAETTYMKET